MSAAQVSYINEVSAPLAVVNVDRNADVTSRRGHFTGADSLGIPPVDVGVERSLPGLPPPVPVDLEYSPFDDISALPAPVCIKDSHGNCIVLACLDVV